MKTFKQTDFFISLVLMLGFGIASAVNRDFTFIAGYFAVGFWQVISMIVHAWNGWFTNKGSVRNIYHAVVALILGSALAGLALPELLMVELYLLLFAAPFMALFYCWLCYRETWVKMKRPLAILK